LETKITIYIFNPQGYSLIRNMVLQILSGQFE
jgi:hypothetical protein